MSLRHHFSSYLQRLKRLKNGHEETTAQVLMWNTFGTVHAPVYVVSNGKFISLVRILFSLLAVLFDFDIVVGEKELC